jgi:truncated hemoglobin YjbI
MTEQSLYERLGGVNAISMVVDRFSDQIVKNPKLNVNPALKEWNESGQLPGLKFMRTLWLCQTAGGPFDYTGKELGKPTRTSTSHQKSSTRLERRLPARSTTSMYQSAKSRKSCLRSSRRRPT